MFKQNLGRGDMTRIALYMHVTFYLNYGLSFFFSFFFLPLKILDVSFLLSSKLLLRRILFVCLFVCLFFVCPNVSFAMFSNLNKVEVEVEVCLFVFIASHIAMSLPNFKISAHIKARHSLILCCFTRF